MYSTTPYPCVFLQVDRSEKYPTVTGFKSTGSSVQPQIIMHDYDYDDVYAPVPSAGDEGDTYASVIVMRF